jgi:regulatory protein
VAEGEAHEQAMGQAFNYLSFRSRSVREIEQYLAKKGHPPETISSVVQRLTDLHYLDDSHFAVSWVESRRRSGGRGPNLLRAELLKKGVARDTVDLAIESAAGEQDQLALDAARRKAASLPTSDYAEFNRKVGGYLSRRGFSAGVVWDTVKRVWRERGEEGSGHDDE